MPFGSIVPKRTVDGSASGTTSMPAAFACAWMVAASNARRAFPAVTATLNDARTPPQT